MANSQQPSAAPALSIPRKTAVRRRLGRKRIIFALGLARIPQQRPAGTRKRLGLLFGYRHKRRNQCEGLTVGSHRVKIERFLADCDALPAPQYVPVVVHHLPERSFINDGLLVFPALALFALVSRHRHAAEFNALNRAPWIGLAIQDFDPVEARVLERIQEEVLAKRAGDAAAPQFGVL